MSHESFILTFHGVCADCGWDSGELPSQLELFEAIAAHHALEVHVEPELRVLLEDNSGD